MFSRMKALFYVISNGVESPFHILSHIIFNNLLKNNNQYTSRVTAV